MAPETVHPIGTSDRQVDEWRCATQPAVAADVVPVYARNHAAERQYFWEAAMAIDDERTWRVGHKGRDLMYYEEVIDGRWERIDLDGEMLVGRAHHVIYFPSQETWSELPAWARDRREEIVGRIKGVFKQPDYAYEDG
jgi:hypothetical protein